MEFRIISPDSALETGPPDDHPAVQSAVELNKEFYKRVGFTPPWVSYLATLSGAVVGVAAYKGAPTNGKVEIAYATFAPNEGKGYATLMVRELVRIAVATDPSVKVTARTLLERNGSHRVLEKCNFEVAGTVMDSEDGEVLEWQLP